MSFFLLVEAAAIVVVLVVVFATPPLDLPWSRRFAGWFERLAARPIPSIGLVGAVAVAGSIGLSFFLGIPKPQYHDEFSYLLAADTFSKARLTNPPHPLWIHFESFHIIQQPTYASKFFPAQGLILAAGNIIGGHPVFGVWASVGLAAAAICWMLQAWLPRRWALFGALLSIIQVRYQTELATLPGAFFGYWSQSYWGGSLAAAGGAMMFGAFHRIVRRPCWYHALLFGMGLMILANSRPFEGLIASFPAMAALVWMGSGKGFPTRVLFCQVVLPILLVVVPAAAAMGFYNLRVTGDLLRLPYQVYEETYGAAPLFLFQQPSPPKVYNHEQMQNFYLAWSLKIYDRQHSFSGLVWEIARKVQSSWEYYIGPTLTIPFVTMLLLIRKDRWIQFALVTCGLLVGALFLETWLSPHYPAPVTGLVVFLIVQGMRRMRPCYWKERPIGCRLIWAIPCLFVALQLVMLWLRLAYPTESWNPRAQMLAELNAHEGRHLVIVKYVSRNPGYFHSHFESVYNEADIDGARVVWARAMDALRNRKLLEYFNDRYAWLLSVDEDNLKADIALISTPKKLDATDRTR